MVRGDFEVEGEERDGKRVCLSITTTANRICTTQALEWM